MSDLPDAQARAQAVDIGGSYIVQAPAGSGKTTLLVQRYLKLLAVSSKPEEVLAITFTVKAANEMRERVLGELNNPDSDIAQRVLERDQAAGWQLQRNPNRLKIQTIDSFAASLIQRLPLHQEASIDGGPSDNAAVLLRQAAERTLHRLYDDDPVNTSLLTLLQNFDNDANKLADTLTQMLARRDEWMLPLAQTIGTATQGIEALRDVLVRCNEALQHRYTSQLKDTLDDAALADLRMVREHLGLTSESRLSEFARRMLTSRGQLRKKVTKAQGFEDKASRAAGLALLQQLDAAGLERCLADAALLPDIDDATAASLYDVALVMFAALESLTQVFRERNQIDFAELLISAERALGRCDDPSELALALDYRIRHILVDEFQDTSLAQLRLFEQLTQGWFEGSGESFFAVGDPMQSIYRFRDADVGRFLDVQKKGIGDLALTPLRLTSNFRSADEVVDWCNAVFPNVLGSTDDAMAGRVAYASSHAQAGSRGEVSTHLFRSEQDEAEHIAEDIARRIADNPTDTVAILVRNRFHVQALLPSLRACRIEWMGTDIETLADTTVASDVVSLLRVLENATEPRYWFNLCRAPFIGASLQELEQLSHAQDLLGAMKIEPGEHFQRLVHAWQISATLADEVPPREVIETFLFHVGGYAAYSAQEQTQLERILEFVDRLEQSGLDAQQLETTLRSQFVVTPELRTVEILTVHKAKGLEFDHVYLPFLNRANRNTSAPLLRCRNIDGYAFLGVKGEGFFPWLQQLNRIGDEAELGRLLYVACTRAKSSLCLSWSESEERVASGTLASLVKSHVEPVLHKPKDTSSNAEHRRDQQSFQRLSPSYRFVQPVVTPTTTWASDHSQNRATDTDATAFGNVIHDLLSRLVGKLELPSEPILQRALAKYGVSETRLGDVQQLLQNVLNDDTGKWLMSVHDQDACELTIAARVGPSTGVTRRVDRTFVESGVRWIVDYKTHTSAQQPPSDTELDRETVEQLREYRRIAAMIWPQPIRLAAFNATNLRFIEVT